MANYTDKDNDDRVYDNHIKNARVTRLEDALQAISGMVSKMTAYNGEVSSVDIENIREYVNNILNEQTS